jgi:hypothetical protein
VVCISLKLFIVVMINTIVSISRIAVVILKNLRLIAIVPFHRPQFACTS